MNTTKKEQRSNKWAFLLYQECAPEDYLNVLEEIHVPFFLSPWHDKNVNSSTGEFKKSHKHGALFFETLKSYSQVSELISDKLNAPTHVEVVMNPKGMYDYFTHASFLFSSEKISIDYISQRLGHSNIQTTMNYYLTLMPEKKHQQDADALYFLNSLSE